MDDDRNELGKILKQQRMTVLLLYGVQFILGGIALSMINADFQQFLSLLMIVGIMILFAWVFLVRVEVYSGKPSA